MTGVMRAVLLMSMVNHGFTVTKEGVMTVRSVFEDDPLVQEHLAAEGAGWSLVPHDTHCDHHQLRPQCRGLHTCFIRNNASNSQISTMLKQI